MNRELKGESLLQRGVPEGSPARRTVRANICGRVDGGPSSIAILYSFRPPLPLRKQPIFWLWAQKTTVNNPVAVTPPDPGDVCEPPFSDTPKLMSPGRCAAILLAASTAALIGVT